MNVVLHRTVVVDSDWRFDNLCGSHLQSQRELYEGALQLVQVVVWPGEGKNSLWLPWQPWHGYFVPCAPQPVNKKKRMGRVVMVYLLNNKRIYFLCLFEAVYCNPQPTLTREVTCFYSTNSDSTYYTIRISRNIKRLKQSKEAVEHMHSVDHNEICATLNWVRKTDELVVLILKLRISKTTKIKHSKLKIL